MSDTSKTDATGIDSLQEAIDRAVSQLSSETISFFSDPKLKEELRSDRRFKAALDVLDAAKLIADEIALDERLPKGNFMIRTSPGGAVSFTLGLGSHLLQQAMARGSSSEAIAWAQKVFGTSSSNGKLVSPLWGISVSQPVDLGNGLSIVPIEELVDSAQLRWLYRARFDDGLVPSMLPMQEFAAAIVMEYTMHDAVYGAEPKGDDARTFDELQRIEDIFGDIPLILTAVARCPVLPVCRWFSYDDADINDAMGSAGRQSKLFEILPLHVRMNVALDGEEAKRIFNEFLGLPEKARKTVRISLRRLHQGLLRHGPGDAAVELAVALESLLGDRESKSEMTHKVTVRAVRILGGDTRQRKRNYTMFKKAYSLRSGLVHNGEEPSSDIKFGDKKIPAREFLKIVANCCAELICQIISLGDIPDWTEFDYTEHSEAS